jgi:haloacetate dehalogenase
MSDDRAPTSSDDPWKSPKGDQPISAERRHVLRVASALAGAALLDGAQAQQASTAAPAAPLSIPGFTPSRIETSGGVTINAVKGGSGPPLLLLHGAPLTLYTWRDVAPGLAEDYTVVAADLRGYGDSSKPQGLPDQSNY